MNIVLLCKSWNHKKALEILTALRQQSLQIRGIVALASITTKNSFSDFVRKTYEQNHHLPATIAEYAQQHQIEMVMVQDLNSDASVAALKRMETDILLLGGVPIIRANVLAVPKICTLNVHMGLLPKFRGMNVAEWSIFCGEPVGVTVHQVDPGVDTGAILYREIIEVSDCANIEMMRAKVSRQQHQILARCTRLFIEKKFVPEPQKKEGGKQYYMMHEKLRKVVEQRLSKGYIQDSLNRNDNHTDKE